MEEITERVFIIVDRRLCLCGKLKLEESYGKPCGRCGEPVLDAWNNGCPGVLAASS